jgi:hypothetical protein
MIDRPSAASPLCGDSLLEFGGTSYVTQYSSEDVAVGDFDRDGSPDLAVVNFDTTSNSVSVLLNSGDGTFGPPVNYAVGVNPVSLGVADLNGDDLLDLAVVNFSGPPSLSVLLGNGNGTFQPAIAGDAGPNAHSVTVADFNQDLKLDLAVANYDFNTVSILIGDGDGGFGPPVSYGVGLTAAFLAQGDFNGDLKLDVAAANLDSDDVSVLLGRGDGSFEAASAYPTGAGPYGIAAADLDGDRNLDLVTADVDGNTVSVMLGDGTGAFATPLHYGVGINPGAISVGRLDGDGVLDVVVTNFNSHVVSVLRGNGDGTLQQPVAYGTELFPSGVTVADVDRDSKSDIVAVSFIGAVNVLLNQSRLGALLDDFDRANGTLGPQWSGQTAGFGIVGQQLEVGRGGGVYWAGGAFGADQEVCATFVGVDPDGLQSVFLKIQQGDWRNGGIAVSNDPRNGRLIVVTYHPRSGARLRGAFPARLVAGDQLGARALQDGTVQAYVNGVLVGQVSAGGFFVDLPGQIGLGFAGAEDARLDDFGGGDAFP